MYASLCECVCLGISVCECKNTHVRVCILCVSLCVYMKVCLCVCVCRSMYASVLMCMCTCQVLCLLSCLRPSFVHLTNNFDATCTGLCSNSWVFHSVSSFVGKTCIIRKKKSCSGGARSTFQLSKCLEVCQLALSVTSPLMGNTWLIPGSYLYMWRSPLSQGRLQLRLHLEGC